MLGRTWSSLEDLRAILKDGEVVETDEGFNVTQVMAPEEIIKDNNLYFLAVPELFDIEGEVPQKAREAIIRVECLEMTQPLEFEVDIDKITSAKVVLEKEEDGTIYLDVDVDMCNYIGYGRLESIRPAKFEYTMTTIRNLYKPLDRTRR